LFAAEPFRNAVRVGADFGSDFGDAFPVDVLIEARTQFEGNRIPAAVEHRCADAVDALELFAVVSKVVSVF
jgi:hypothetical protein